MTRAEFERLVRRAEAHAERNPAGYRARLIGLGALGYLYIALLFLGTVGLMAAIVGIVIALGGAAWALKPLLLLGAFAVILLRAVWVRVHPSEGIPLHRRQAPRLFELLDEIRHTLRGPKIHRVLVDDQFNAAIQQVPRLGVFGWHRNYLILGLPLVSALAPDELKAVLAHEYGHLSGSHGKTGAWIYRIRMTWARLYEALSRKGGAGAAVVRRFFEWYVPFFSAYSFILARANEYDADRAAAAVAGASAAGTALVRVDIVGRYLDRDFWPTLFRTAEAEPEAPSTVYTQLCAADGLRRGPEGADALLAQALTRETDLADTHPSLTDRLAALGVEPGVPAPPEESAAEALLGQHLATVRADLDERWRMTAGPWWADRHEQIGAARARLAELTADGLPDTTDELWEVAGLVDQLDGRAAAIPAYRAVLERNPTHVVGRLIIGMHMIEQDERDAGLALMKEAMQEHDHAFLLGAQALRDHHAGAGRHEEAEGYHEQLMARQAVLDDRDLLPFANVYEPHGLPEETVGRVREILEECADVRAAYLVRRQPKLSDEPVIVVGLRTWRSGIESPEAIAQALTSAGIDPIVVVLAGNGTRLRRHLRRVAGSRVL